MSLRVAVCGACPYPVPQGSQVYLRDTALALRDAGHAVCLVTYGHGRGDDRSGLVVHRAPRLPLDGRTEAGPTPVKPLLDLALARTLRRVVRRERIDVVCAHNYEALAAALLARVRPVVYFAHNALADELPHYFGGARWAARAGAAADRFLPRRADLVVAAHGRLADYLRAHGCREVAVVPPPVDAAAFPAAVVGNAVPPVLYTGNLDGYQNLGLLTEAMARVRARVPGARLVVATASARPFPCDERVDTPGLDALRDVLARDAVVAAPRVSWSGYPIKLLNAMAAGKAVVACASAAAPLVHGETGWVVADDDAEAYAAGLDRLLTDPALRERLGRAAREAALTTHARPRIGAELSALLRRVCRVSG